MVSNISGAIIFVAYVISALFLTVFISYSLISLYRKNIHANDSKRGKELYSRLQIFLALSVLSFSTLSYHMLNYLLVSFQQWTETNKFALVFQTLGSWNLLFNSHERAKRFIWQWLTSSTLFRDFAETICGTSTRFWWTQQALLVTMGWSVYMSFEGMTFVP